MSFFGRAVKQGIAAAALIVAGATLAGPATAGGSLKDTRAHAPAFSWTGLYVGVHAGGGWSDTGYDLIQNDVSFDFDGDGGLIGGYIGYNFQLSPSFVAGLEVEGSFADIDRSSFECTIAQTALCGSNVSALGSVRARIGWLPTNQTLIYLAGGWGFADASFDRVFQPGGVPFTSGVDETLSGGVIGAGIEVVLAGSWLARLQYDHYEFDSETHAVPALSNVSDTRVDLSVDTVRAGVALKF